LCDTRLAESQDSDFGFIEPVIGSIETDKQWFYFRGLLRSSYELLFGHVIYPEIKLAFHPR
jgi:hypothetical protein